MKDFLTEANISKRERDILARLAVHILDDLGCAVVAPSKAAWTDYPLPHPYRFGWMAPTPIGDHGALIISLCPELIAETTIWLSAEELDIYLTCVEAFIDAMVAHSSTPASEIYASVTDMLYEKSPETLDLVSQVEARALDAGIVAAG